MISMVKKPAYDMFLTDKNNTKKQTKAGAAWVNPKGSISIQLSPGISLSYDDCTHLFINLYLRKDNEHPPSEPESNEPGEDVAF